jgi:ferredoxin
MTGPTRTVLLLALPVACAALGWFSGPFLSGAHRTVQLARQVNAWQVGAVKGSTPELDAFRLSGGQTSALRLDAGRVETQMRWVGMWLGAWSGLVVSVNAWGATRRARRIAYEPDPGRCLSCGRCFLFCPRERRRLKERRRAGEDAAHG